MARSSSGLGRWPLTPVTRVRIPYALQFCRSFRHFFIIDSMKHYKKHIFICENTREEKDQRKSCGKANSAEIRQVLKSRLKELNLSVEIRANAAGCLGQCNHGPIAVVYPEGVWYKHLNVDDVDEIIKSHLINNKPVVRLLLEEDE